jgi:hypothetical protein
MRVWICRWSAVAFAVVVASAGARAQVAPEPSVVTADLTGRNVVQAHVAVPRNQFVLGGMLRFALFDDLDLGARVGSGFVDGAEDYVYVGGDGRYALLGQQFGRGGPAFNLSFHGGLGVRSSESLTRWKLPVGFPAGLTFPLVRGALEIYTHPRLELGFQNVGDESDLALLLDFGAQWRTPGALLVLAAIRFGDGIFDEGDRGVFTLGVGAGF